MLGMIFTDLGAQFGDMGGARATAAPHHIHAVLRDKFAENFGEGIGFHREYRGAVHFDGQARIGDTRNRFA